MEDVKENEKYSRTVSHVSVNLWISHVLLLSTYIAYNTRSRIHILITKETYYSLTAFVIPQNQHFTLEIRLLLRSQSKSP